ncbi:MAG: transposase domain-containing protein, partial [Ideonella sp.]|nr:transposase domain-containing protein [Ideonella sp.]
MAVGDRLGHRRQHVQRLWEKLHAWLRLRGRDRVLNGLATLPGLAFWPFQPAPVGERWAASWKMVAVSVDNNHIENLMRPWAMGRKAWLFAGSQLAGQRAAMVMSLVQSAKLHGHDPWVYLKDVLERLLAHPNNTAS